MLTFAVFDEHGPAREWPLRKAYLFGPDEIPVQGEVWFENSLIHCEKPTTDAAGLALQFEVGLPPGVALRSPATVKLQGGPAQGDTGLGLLTLRTSLLPDRAEPYLLSLELARHRIMMVLNKLEQWSLFDLPAEHAIQRQFEAARTEFTASLVALCHRIETGGVTGPDPASLIAADAAARRSLALAIDAGEQLALLNAERQCRVRADGSLYKHMTERATESMTADRSIPENAAKNADGVGVVLPQPAQIGCSVSPASYSEALTRVISGTCDFVSMPMRWIDMEPTEGKYSFAKTDKWIEWAVRTAKLPVHAGPLIDFRELCVPEWLYIWENDYETLRDMMIEHITQVVTRYRRTVTRWTVCSGLHVNSNVKLSYEQIMDLTKVCVLLTKKIHPQAKITVEVQEPWGEYFADDRKSLPPTFYAESVLNSGLAIDSVGVRLQVGAAASGQASRDLMAISALLDRYAAMERPVHVTALGAPSGAAPVAAAAAKADEDDDGPLTLKTRQHIAGFWRLPWSDAVQATWLTDVMAILASKACVQSVCWQDLADAPLSPRLAEMPLGGLFTAAGAPKASAGQFSLCRSAMKDGKSPL